MARINIRNGNIQLSTNSPVEEDEFFVTVPLNNQEFLGGGPNGCQATETINGHRADLNLTVETEGGEDVTELNRRDICVPLGNEPYEETFGVTVNEPTRITITAEVNPQGSDPPDQESVSIDVVERGGSEDPTTPGNGDDDDGPDFPNIPDPPKEEEAGLLAFAVQNPGATLALAGGAAIAISSFSSSITE